jgi:hypothetical protein
VFEDAFFVFFCFEIIFGEDSIRCVRILAKAQVLYCTRVLVPPVPTRATFEIW